MIVQSFDRFAESTVFDPDTGAFDTQVAGGITPAAAVRGHYGRLGETPVVFYRSGEGLLLRAGDTVVAVDDTVTVSHRQDGSRRTVRVTDRASGRDVFRLEYTVPAPIVAPEDDPTPNASPEDFDFGLFIANVANDPQRRSRVYNL
jgi:hypothetical protein